MVRCPSPGAGKSDLHLLDKGPEHGVTTRSAHGVDGRLPRLPAIDQRSSEEQLDQFEVKGADVLECGQLLELIEFSVQDVSLNPHSRQ
jgi:hypothetical protein